LTDYTRGVAFILEGPTEKIFYRNYLKWVARIHKCAFSRAEDVDDEEVCYEWFNGCERILVKYNVVGTITQIAHSSKWFSNRCSKKYKMPWKVILCYDTDNSQNDISKFYQGDWKRLRKDLKKARAEEIIDMAACADIEDIILCDMPSVCNYLGIDIPENISGRKGKAKMKALYRSCGNTYHEGERAGEMIGSLDFQRIVEKSPLELKRIISIMI